MTPLFIVLIVFTLVLFITVKNPWHWQPITTSRLGRLALILFIAGTAIVANNNSVWAQPDPPPLLEITKDFGGSTALDVPSGEEFTYYIAYRCASITNDCVNTTITDVLPPEVVYVEGTGPVGDITGINYDSGSHIVTVDFVEPLGAGSTGILEITVKFPPGTLPGTTAVNQATSSTDGGTFDSGLVTATATGAFEMYIDKRVANDFDDGVIGTDFTTNYSLNVCNPDEFGGVNLTNVTITDTLPAEATFVSASPTGFYDSGTHSIVWTHLGNGGTLPDVIPVTSGCSLTLNVMVRFDPNGRDDTPATGDEPVAGNTAINTMDIIGSPEDGSPDFIATDPVGILLIEPYFDDGNGKNAGSPSSYIGRPIEELPGGDVNYAVSYTNEGTITATNVTVTDVLPSQVRVESIQISPVVDPVHGFYETNNNPGAWLPFPGNGYTVGVTVPVTMAVTATPIDIELTPGDYLTGIRWELGDVPPGTPTWSANIATFIDPGVAGNVTFANCATTFADYVEGGTPDTSTNNYCVNVTTIETRAIPRVRKTTSDDSLLPGEVTQFTLEVYNPSEAHNNVVAPLTLADLLPERLELVVPDVTISSGYSVPTATQILDGDWFTFSATDGAPAPTYVFTPTFNAQNDTLLRWQWDAPYEMAPGEAIAINFYARVLDYTIPQSLANEGIILWDDAATTNALACDGSDGVSGYTDGDDVDQDSDVGESGCFVTTPVVVEAFLAMDSQKFVDGTLDVNPGWTDYDYTVTGGAVDWRMIITNTSNVTATNIVAYDVFPHVGDTGTIDLSSRGSQWRPHLIFPITDTMGLPMTISYSQSTNPCRPEILPSGPAGCTDDWSATPPADITTVQAVRFEFCDSGGCLELPPDNGAGGGTLEFNWHMVAPNNAAVGDVAWNSFGFTAEGGGLKLLPSEPLRVGIELAANTLPGYSIGDYVWLDLVGRQDDGIQQPEETGLSGVRVELWDADTNTLLDFRTTGPDGNGDPGYYEFINVPNGNYFIRFFQPQDGLSYTFSPGEQGADTAVDSNGITSDTDPTFGPYIQTNPFTILDADDYTIDQGMWIEADYGDAPAAYPVEADSQANPADAARHIIVPNFYLGSSVDAETDGQPDANAWGDDNEGNDDEDGVTFEDYIGTAVNPTAVMTIGDANDITVNTTVPAGTTGYLNAWIDFNGDGDWTDAGEQIATDMPSTGGLLNFSVNPAATVTTGKTYARFRFSTESGLLSTGSALDGEVEDYVVQFVPQPVKSIIDTSETHTSGTSPITIGEIVRYRLEVTVPEGTMTAFEIEDHLPPGLQYLDDGTASVSWTADTPITHAPLTVSGSPFSSGTNPTFELGTVTNNDDDINAELIIVEFNALLLNEINNTNDSASNANRRRNNFDVRYNNYIDRSNNVDTRIAEPYVTIAKSVTTTPTDAGDTVVYELVATAGTGTYVSTAFDINITDLLDDDLMLVSVVTSEPVYATAVDNSNILGNQVDVDFDELRPGDSVTVTVTATVNSTAESGETIPNSANLTHTSLPGPNGTTGNTTGSDTPGTSGQNNGERDGSASPTHNDYHDTDNQDVDLAEPTFDKQLSPTTYTIGENITFDLLVTLPEGVTEDLVIVDDLPVGLNYVSHTVVTTAVASGGLLAADFNGTLAAPTVSAPGGDGVDVSWNFGDTTTAGDNVTSNNSFLIRVTAVVLDVFSNQTGDTLTNTGTLTYTRNGSSRDIVDSEDVNLIEPVLMIDKNLVTPVPSPLDAGTDISYEIVLQHAGASLADAYDVVVADAVPSQLFNVRNVNVSATGIAAPDFDLTGNDIRVPSVGTGTFDLPQGATVTITFDATIGGTAVPGQDIDNTAAATWTSLDGSPPEERHGGATDPDGSDYYNNGSGSATDDYETADTATLTVDGTATTKALVATSAGHTSGSNVTLGEVVTYTITTTVAEGTVPSLEIIDNLPPGLEYVSGTAGVDDTGFNGTLPNPTITPDGGSGGDVTFTFSGFTVPADNDPTNNSFSVQLQAVVLDVPGNDGVNPGQTTLTNNATVQIGSGTPETVPPVDVTVVEPQIVITKDFDKTQITPNESTVVTLVVENRGTSTAFDLVIEDPLDDSVFTNVTEGTTPAGWTFSTSSSGGDTIVRYDLDAGDALPVGASVTFTFTVTMHPDLAPSPPNVNNVATVTDASTLDSTVNDGDEDNATNIDEEREYTTDDNDDLEIIVPDLVLTKTNGVTYVSPGDLVVYDLNVENVGGADATGVVITETVPANATFNLASSSATWAGCADGAAAGTTCILTIGDLNSGDDTTVQFAVNIDDPLPANTADITNTAVTGDDGTKGNDPTPPNNTDDHTDTVTAAIGDYVWEDLNANGTQDDGNTGINGVTVNLYLDDGDGIPEPGLDDGAPVATTVTINDGGGSPGYYIFDNLIPDDYFVEFVAPAGYAESPQDQGGNDTADSDADVVTGVTAVTTLDPGERDMTWDAGYFQPVSLGNRVWLDANADGDQDGGETNIAGVELALFLADGTTPAVDVDGVAVVNEITDGSGTYNFTNLPPGSYVVQVLPSNWNAGNVFGTGGTHAGALGSPGAGADDQDNTDDNGNNDGVAALGSGVQSGVINLTINGEPTLEDPQETIADNDSDLTIDFGFYQPVSLGNRVWFDEDGDGVQDAGEPNIENVEVALYLADGVTPAVDVAGNAVANVTTDANGYYNFGNLPPGDYVVEITATNWNAGNVFGTGGTYAGAVGSPGAGADDQDNTDDNGDSDGTAASGGVQSSVITLAAQTEPTSEDAQETAPDNNSDLTIDFGFYQPVSLGNRVWFDENGDGVQDAGEPDIQGVEMALFLSDGTIPAVDVDGNAVSNVTTDGNGYYNFGNLPPGNYVVEMIAVNWNAGNVFGTGGIYEGAVGSPGVGADDQDNTDDNGDNDGTAASSGVQSSVISLISNDEPTLEDAQEATANNNSDLTIDFGVYQPVSLGNRVWFDVDADGVQDAGETGIPGVEVALFLADGTTPARDVDNALLGARTTDASGYYNFDNLPPGEYVVEIVANNWTGANVFGPTGAYANALGSPGLGADNQNNTDDNGNNDGTAASAGVQSSVISLISNDEPTLEDSQEASADNNSDLTIDFGFYLPVSIGNRVWLDTNANGVQDAGENGIQGVELALFLSDGTTPAVDMNGAAVTNITTDASGYYNFNNLPPGDYVVEVVATNWNAGNIFGAGGTYEDALGSPGVGADDQNNTDDNGNNDGTAASAGVQSGVIELRSAQEPVDEDVQEAVSNNNSDLTIDFGFYQLASIGDYVWLDANQDGLQDSDEFGIPNVTVTLYDTTDAVIDTTTTDAYGFYYFTDLTPDDYYIVVTSPAGYSVTSHDQGVDDTVDSDIDGSGRTADTTLDSNEDDPTWDAGLYIDPASIGDFVWLDANQDGIQDGGELGIGGVTVELYDSSDNLIDTTTTLGDGSYSFTNLPPGDYYIVVTPPAGYSISPQDQTGETADSDIDGSGQTATTTLDPNENDPTWDAGLYILPASLGDYVWLDANLNGVQDAGEYGVPGVTVNLYDSSDTFIATTTTDALGNYSFTNLAPAGYHIEVVPPAGYTITGQDQGGDDTLDSDINPSTGLSINTTLASGENDPTWDAGLHITPAGIGDFVWLDANQDGIQDGDEYGIGGVTVELYNSSGNLIDTTTTDGNGGYSFTNLPPGDYYVVVTPPAGYTIVAQNQGDDTLDSDIDPTPGPTFGQTDTTTLDPNENDPTWDGGLYTQPAGLGDIVWLDADQDGIQDGDEFGVPGVTVNLYDSADTFIGSTTTDAFGQYGFANLPPGDYYVEMVPPAGYTITLQDQGGDETADSDINTGTGRTIVTNLVAGENDPTWDGGLYIIPASLGDFVWLDANQDGLQVANEFGVPNVTVNLYDASDNLLDTTTTDAYGGYSFTNLPPGDYYVEMIPPAGYTITSQDAGDDALDSDINGSGQTIITTLASGQNDPTWDGGLYTQPVSLGDYVWLDANLNGTQDFNEGGVIAVTVSLYDGSGNLLDSTSTNASGNYSFTNLPPGDYYVQVMLPNGYAFTTQDLSGNDATDSDVDTTTGQTIDTTLLAGENDPTWDAGLVPAIASLGDYVWEDLNGDGIQDAGEPGVPGVEVHLYDDSNTQIMTTTTDVNGRYQFTNLTPGTYHVEFVLPSGYDFTQQDQGADTADSDADTTTGLTVPTNLTPGENDVTWDAGLIRPLDPLLAAIGNYVWEDLDSDGLQDAGEPGVENVTVNLYDSNNVLTDTMTTDANGLYQFIDLTPGDYHIEFILPAGYDFTGQDQGGDAIDSDADMTTGLTIVANLVAGENDTTWDAGLVQQLNPALAAIGNYVWLDADEDGVQAVSEPGVENVTVNLYDGLGNYVDTTTTDANGLYQFIDLTPGDYFVEFVPPAGYILTGQDQGGDDALDSDGDADIFSATFGQTIVTNLVAGENDTTWDAGLYVPSAPSTASLGDFVWLDADVDGIQDAGESGVANVMVNLYTGTGVLVDTTTTNATGFYEFTNLLPGDYYVEFVPPTGYALTFDNSGVTDLDDSDADPVSGQTAVTTLTAGENDPTWDAGLYQTVRLGNRIWFDTDNDGLLDAGEQAVANVLVELLDALGNPVISPVTGLPITTTTDATGRYVFDSIPPGTYIVRVAAENFDEWTDPLYGFVSSRNNVSPDPAADPDVNSSDGDDNGRNNPDPANGGIVSYPVTVTVGNEPTNEGQDEDGSYPNANSNLTVDFGFFELLTLGNYIWLDNNENSTIDSGEPGVGGVVLYLLDGNGDPVLHPVTNQPISTTTNSSGFYQFTNLYPGEYRVLVGAENFQAGGALAGYWSSPGAVDPDDNADTDDNGLDEVEPWITGIVSDPVQLDYDQEPDNYDDSDDNNNTNLSVDMGFVATPTAVTLTSFTATNLGSQNVRINWTTESEVDNFGFRIYRSGSNSFAGASLIHFEPTAVPNGSGPGASYSYTDTVPADGLYYYWLVDVETDDDTAVHGPISVNVTPFFNLYLPMVIGGN
ncbi:MAG: hypothetical protein CL608_24140 [Anaerolineaceae bacterium]|nr:hypothetical protein [Anaerolineaceae bacterium]